MDHIYTSDFNDRQGQKCKVVRQGEVISRVQFEDGKTLAAFNKDLMISRAGEHRFVRVVAVQGKDFCKACGEVQAHQNHTVQDCVDNFFSVEGLESARRMAVAK